MALLTIFTPTWNRAELLSRLYTSLLQQSNLQFVWLVVDDGSTDNTGELVESWRASAPFPIEYHYKENGGMHTAHNLAYQAVQTELNVCIDSDDYIGEHVVQSIYNCWEKHKHKPELAGMIGLDEDCDGNVIGTVIPEPVSTAKLGELYSALRVRGDKKLVIRTDVARKYLPYPEFSGEKLVPLSWLYTHIDQHYDWACENEVWVTVDYQPDGSSGSVIKQYFQSPRGFREQRKLDMVHGFDRWLRIRSCIHYGVSNLILRDALAFIKSPRPFMTLLALPASVCMYLVYSIAAGKHHTR